MINYKLVKILSWVSTLIAIGLIAWKIFGSSPSLTEITTGIIIAGVIQIFRNEKKISNLEIHQEYNKDNFRRIETEIKEIKTDLNGGFKEMRNRFERIEKKLS